MIKHEGLFRKVGALALSAGISTIVGSMGTGLIVKFLADVGGKYLENLEYNKIQAILRSTHPSELNHHLQKALREAINCALKNIEILYAEKFPESDQKQALQKLTDNLQNAVIEQILIYNGQTDKSVVALIDEASDDQIDALIQALQILLHDLPEFNAKETYISFFRKQFVPQLQLCFSEELKKPANHEVWVAYQRLLTNQLKESLQESIRLGQESNNKLERLTQEASVSLPRISKERLSALKDLLKTLDKTEIRLEERFKLALDGLIADLSNKMDRIVERTEQTSIKIDHLHYQSYQTQTKLEQFNHQLSTNWVSKYTLFSLLGFLLMLFIFTLVYIDNQNEPFDLTLFVKPLPTLKLNSEYPIFDGGELVLNWGVREEKRPVLKNGEVTFKQIPAKYRDRYIYLKLQATNWQTKEDSLKINPEKNIVFIVPNNRLSSIAGYIRNIDGTKGIQNVTVLIDDTTVITNQYGHFQVFLPYHRQKKRYNLSIFKQGFEKIATDYIPDSSEPEYRLKKN